MVVRYGKGVETAEEVIPEREVLRMLLDRYVVGKTENSEFYFLKEG